MADTDHLFPLPQGVNDAVLNRGQLARALSISEPTLDRWIGDGLPVLEGGTNGRPYKFQLSTCWAWRCRRDSDETRATAESERAVQQMRLALVGGSVGDDAERVLSPKQRAEIYEEEFRWTQAARARGELVAFKDVEDLLEALFILIRGAVVALPDRLQRECNLNGRQVERAVCACDDLLTEAHNKIRDGLLSLQPSRLQPNGHELELQR